MPRLTIPLPPRELKVNRTLGVHWGSQRAAKLAYQMEVAAAAKAQRGEWQGVEVSDPGYPVCLVVTVYLGKNQRADGLDIGAWIKSGMDSLVEIGVWPDDGSAYLNPVTVTVERDWARPRVELEW